MLHQRTYCCKMKRMAVGWYPVKYAGNNESVLKERV